MKEISQDDPYKPLQCTKCATDIWVFNHPFSTASTMPAMEAAGLAYIAVESGTVVTTMTYKIHHCTGVRPVVEETGEVVMTRREIDEANNESAIHRFCPKCEALPGEPCWHMAKLKRGVLESTNWPHIERLDGPTRLEGGTR